MKSQISTDTADTQCISTLVSKIKQLRYALEQARVQKDTLLTEQAELRHELEYKNSLLDSTLIKLAQGVPFYANNTNKYTSSYQMHSSNKLDSGLASAEESKHEIHINEEEQHKNHIQSNIRRNKVNGLNKSATTTHLPVEYLCFERNEPKSVSGIKCNNHGDKNESLNSTRSVGAIKSNRTEWVIIPSKKTNHHREIKQNCTTVKPFEKLDIESLWEGDQNNQERMPIKRIVSRHQVSQHISQPSNFYKKTYLH